jgi:alpha-galactosidase/6-phospho-beta-glucosidase family protein
MEAVDIAAAIFILISTIFSIMLGIEVNRTAALRKIVIELYDLSDKDEKEIKRLRKEISKTEQHEKEV